MEPDALPKLTRIPRHVAIVMDGNGRWAEKRKQPRLFGHKAGVDSVRDVVETSRELGVEVLTLYAFSSENWKRPENEVSGLMKILKSFLQGELDRMLRNDIRLISIGEREKLPDSVRSVLEKTIKKTSQNSALTLNLALSYGGRVEIAHCVSRIAEACLAGEFSPADIDESLIDKYLYTAGLPDPDLLIRTGGEHRLSNFLLWQASYAEIFFTPVMWPDFRKSDFLQILEEFGSRERRFGKTGAQIRSS
ncbi:MAG: isoprenyl transferase [Thermodesulfobacteriota bacterium]